MSRFQHPPQSRHDALQPFSRDHYGGLVAARHLTKAAESGDPHACRAALSAFRDAWSNEIAGHLDDEERLLAPLMTESEHCRLLSEHRQLRQLAAAAHEAGKATGLDSAFLGELGRLLHDHIRWEERQLFPALESRLDSSQLARIAAQTAVIESTRPRATCRSESGESDR